MAMAPNASAAATPSLRFPHPSSATGLASPLAGGSGGFRVQFHPSQRGRGVQGRRDGGSHVARVGGLLGGVFGGGGRDDGEATRKKYADTVARINAMEPEVSALSDADLRARTAALQERARAGESLDSLLPEAFAVVREASKRVLGLRPFDVQLIGGMVLHKGEIAEMKTGEGKTLVAILPAYLNSLSGKGVHVVTVNDYLARRDCEWVGQVPRFLGLQASYIGSVSLFASDALLNSVSLFTLTENMTPEQRRENYSCDITYVTNSELGFDYLRDNLAMTVDELVLRNFNYCVIDEVDSILIDEARTPLIISGLAEKPSDRYYKAAKIAEAFERDIHYTVDEKQRNVLLTEQGYADAEEILDINDLYDPREQWASYVLNAIKAKELFLKDVNYIVRSKEVLIVDEFTGRVMAGRRWSDGLHQAIEAKEGFPKLCGMTGTAATESQEFESIYKLKVTVVPTNKPMIRKDDSDVVFRATNGKWRAVLVEISRMNKVGRPVLVGTTSVEQSESLSEQLREAGIPHEVLNAKPENVEREAEIVAQSGRLGAVTIATNMAGRGTDIILGGNAEFMARLKLREILMPRVVNPIDGVIVSKKQMPPRKTWKTNESLFPCELSKETLSSVKDAVEVAVKEWGEKSLTELEAEERLSYSCEKGPTRDDVIANLRNAFMKIADEYKVYTEEEKKKVITAGGLHVVGTERHESRRIDNQLRGRSGRQGDPGSSRFFLSLEDNIFRIFGGDRIQGLMQAFRVEDLPIESKMLTRALDEAQRKVENYFFDIRKQLFEYDEVLNSQRDRVYAERRRALASNSLESLIVEYAELTMDDILEANIGPDTPKENWDLSKLIAKLQQYCYLLDDLTPELLESKSSRYEDLQEYLRKRGREAYFQKAEIVEKQAPGLMKEAERFLILSNIDRLWKEHLQALKFVQQAVGLRGYAQRDPLIEYKLEGYNLFLDMMAQIRRNVIYSVYQFKPVVKNQEEEKPQNKGSKKKVDKGANKLGAAQAAS
ncbi:protein translocase subunit SECA1, chloroplastic [Panicum miliaceum]|uniref:Protein translocase subunit SecA n=1 Tax=Panicum miliaceum TaxID=4540 RepID=A0A3L6QX87_PANMI|nr:protein translocase subunit SECA1, chloroplastic [Panicum miliaceum]